MRIISGRKAIEEAMSSVMKRELTQEEKRGILERGKRQYCLGLMSENDFNVLSASLMTDAGLLSTYEALEAEIIYRGLKVVEQVHPTLTAVPEPLIETPSEDEYDFTENALLAMVKILEENQKQFSDNQIEEEKAELVSGLMKSLKENNVLDLVSLVKFTNKGKERYYVTTKPIVEDRIIDTIVLEENDYNLFSIAIQDSVEQCYDAFETGSNIKFKLDGVCCDFCLDITGEKTPFMRITIIKKKDSVKVTVVLGNDWSE